MIKKLILVLAVIAGNFLLAAPASAYQPLSAACQNAPDSPVCAQASSQKTTNPISGPGGVISIAVNIIAIIAGIAAVVVIILGGFGYITSNGNAEAAAKGRQRVIGAAIGLAITMLSWSIVTYVIDNVIK